MPIKFPTLNKQQQNADTVKLLDERLKGFRAERSHYTVHVSDLTDKNFCAREFALMDTFHRKPKDRYISAAQRVAFDQGMSLHDMCREEWLSRDIVGHWQCRSCSYIVQFSKKPGKCPDCRKQLWKYEEVAFEAMGTSGSIDALIDFNTGKHKPVEIKTMDKDEFKSLVAPVADHRARVLCYLTLIANSDSPYKNRIDLSEGRVLYISKAFGIKSQDHGTILPFKEYKVARNDQQAMTYFNAAKGLEQWRADRLNTPFPSRICENPYCKRAQSCGVLKECWAND